MAHRPVNLFFILLGMLALCLMAVGLIHLFILRFEIGDIYDPYSSLRADPLGTKAYYEGLEASGLYSVERNYRPLQMLSATNNTSLFAWGIQSYQMPGDKDQTLHLYQFLRKGGRLVVGFAPKSWATSSFLRDDSEEEEDEENSENTNDVSSCSISGECTNVCQQSISKWWGVSIEYAATSNGVAGLSTDYTDTHLPREISCHTSMIFQDLDPAWTVIYTREEYPVIIERKIGEGTLVLSALSYCLSNEAMRGERHPSLLTWFPGSSTHIIFDESLHNVRESRGLAQLIRGYQLHLFLAMLTLLVILFLWQRTVPLVPPVAVTDDDLSVSTAQGKDSLSGLVNLLRRNILRKHLLKVCIEEWEKSSGLSQPDKETLSAQFEQVLNTPPESRSKKEKTAVTYNRMSEILDNFKRKRHTREPTS